MVDCLGIQESLNIYQSRKCLKEKSKDILSKYHSNEDLEKKREDNKVIRKGLTEGKLLEEIFWSGDMHR